MPHRSKSGGSKKPKIADVISTGNIKHQSILSATETSAAVAAVAAEVATAVAARAAVAIKKVNALLESKKKISNQIVIVVGFVCQISILDSV